MTRWLKPALFLVSLLPLAHWAWLGWQQQLGANPIEYITHGTGDWTLRLLLLTLLMTPLKRGFGWAWPLRVRRMLGLFTFFYATLHLFTYLWLDQFFDWSEIGWDILERPFITVGILAYVLLLPLAFTSTQGMMKRLGRHWRKLHRLVYVAATLGVLHFWWLVKADVREPLLYAALLGILFLARLYWARLATRGGASSPHRT